MEYFLFPLIFEPLRITTNNVPLKILYVDMHINLLFWVFKWSHTQIHVFLSIKTKDKPPNHFYNF